MFFWPREHGIRLQFIQLGKPTQNPFVESFNGKFREYCLDMHWFRDLAEAREEINEWRRHYNQVRPHRLTASHAAPPVCRAGGMTLTLNFPFNS